MVCIDFTSYPHPSFEDLHKFRAILGYPSAPTPNPIGMNVAYCVKIRFREAAYGGTRPLWDSFKLTGIEGSRSDGFGTMHATQTDCSNGTLHYPLSSLVYLQLYVCGTTLSAPAVRKALLSGGTVSSLLHEFITIQARFPPDHIIGQKTVVRRSNKLYQRHATGYASASCSLTWDFCRHNFTTARHGFPMDIRTSLSGEGFLARSPAQRLRPRLRHI